MEVLVVDVEKPSFLEARWLKSDRVNFAGRGKVDADAGVIYDVILCQVGEAKGHGVNLEQSFIEEGIAYAQKHFAKLGMKCRFGHPAMCNDALGSEVGRFKNFKVVADKMVADLHVYESANLSPTHPGAKDWLLSMAQEDPAAIMCSIVFSINEYYQYDEDGKKVRVYYYTDKGEWVSANRKIKTYVSLKDFMFTDLVDEGAATDKLFSAGLNADKFAVMATELLNENPAIDQFVKEHPQKLVEFLGQRYGLKLEEKVTFVDKVKEVLVDFFKGKPVPAPNEPENTPETPVIEATSTEEIEGMEFKRSLELLNKGVQLTAEELAEIRAEITGFTGANEKFTKEEVDTQVQAAVGAKETELNTVLAGKATEIEQLQAKVKALEGKPADEGTKPVKTGDAELNEGKKETYETSVDKELAAMRKRAGKQ